MKSPRQLANQLVRQWQRGDWREQHLLRNPQAWPLRLPIGEPGALSFRDDSAAVRQHLQQWRAVATQGPGQVEWTARQYRGGATPIDVPTHWVLRPSDCAAAFEQHADGCGTQASADYRALTSVLPQVDMRFHALLLRRLALWRHLSADQIVTATRIALQLEPGCAQGRPLRALALAGNDSKFFERHDGVLKALLDELFEGEASRQGLTAFLDASPEGEHWVLVAPLAEGLLPFRRQRVTTTELQTCAVPGRRILLVENERCLHQLPTPVPDTIAVLGSGLNLSWLSAPWLQERSVAYWGDLDTWGLAMLAHARALLPGLLVLLMDRQTFDTHAHLAVPEPVHAPQSLANALAPSEQALDLYLRTQQRGRLEQEFLPAHLVAQAIAAWVPLAPFSGP
ncbi:Wadjet anti-phage system protein JetD domain-containing protein [Rhodoferax sp. U11-2br]|uniref:Wadjet anti-phage system protein JetD domain-containing protein n=1 Tax=Rhodoferax sp. U11-2br TaxID=2838878 RepID=UPI001BECCFCE|nr:Wadjet anti-phage system protein JetD domain-containing protein [Rhodoferax sp. U11-2br]MBT3066694.1 hypothetical protein [Rhodoferax sp. U11-2br]